MVTARDENENELKIIGNQRELEITMISEKRSIPNDQFFEYHKEKAAKRRHINRIR